MSDVNELLIIPLRQFAKDSIHLVKKCTKPDKKGEALQFLASLLYIAFKRTPATRQDVILCLCCCSNNPHAHCKLETIATRCSVHLFDSRTSRTRAALSETD
eukprot:14165-Heterococcus_DN1.PRE.4